MKKLYSNNKGKIHPSPPPPNADRFSLLPAAIITLAATLSPQDKEVLAYLISCSSSSTTTTATTNFSGNPKSTTKVTGSGGDHGAEFNCDCFRCYMRYWVRWDASPNRQLIHEIIEAYEDGVFDNKKVVVKSKKDGRRKRVSDAAAAADDRGGSGELGTAVEMELNFYNSGVEERSIEGGNLDCEQSGLPCTVRRFVSFMGERIWGVWGII